MMDCKAFVDTLEGKPVAIFGLGASGLSAVRALKKAGARVKAWDDSPAGREAAEKAGAELEPLDENTLAGAAGLVLAPGVPLHHPKPHPVVEAARQTGLEIFGDIEILHRLNHGRKTIGVTGTNGKSTTVSLISHVLERAGQRAVLGGNIGKPVLDLKKPPKDGAFILEVSSFQMDLCPTFTPDIAVLLNLTPDHIDRHGSFEAYGAAKKRLFAGKGTAIVGMDDEASCDLLRDIQKDGERDVIGISVTGPSKGRPEVRKKVYVEGGTLFDGMEAEPVEAGNLKDIPTLQGSHNMQNAAAAYAVCRVMGVEPDTIIEAFRCYPGLPHRQFLVRVMNGVSYVNDSKATNAQAAGTALACFDRMYWIVGGRPKEGGLEGLEGYMSRVKHAFVIGEATEDFSSWLELQAVPHHFSYTLDTALEQAHHMAQEERGQPGGAGVVLLSPACASYDQFKSFEERGDRFTALVGELEG